jgi:hypothetical protein
VAAKLLHVPGLSGLSTIQSAHFQLGRLTGAAAYAVAASIAAMNIFLICQQLVG